MSKFRNLVENLNDIKQWLSQSSIKEGDKKVFDKEGINIPYTTVDINVRK